MFCVYTFVYATYKKCEKNVKKTNTIVHIRTFNTIKTDRREIKNFSSAECLIGNGIRTLI